MNQTVQNRQRDEVDDGVRGLPLARDRGTETNQLVLGRSPQLLKGLGVQYWRLNDLSSDRLGFMDLALLHERLDSTGTEFVDLDMSLAEEVDPSMFAALAAVLARENDHLCVTIKAPAQVKLAFSQAGFPAHIRTATDSLVGSENTDEFPEQAGPAMAGGSRRRLPRQVSVMEYGRFEVWDNELFQDYVETKFGGELIPRMSSALAREFRRSICEVFQNAVDHSETRLGIFACGHYSPQGRILELSIADRGMGIRENIRRRTGVEFGADHAIKWAVEGTHTTRTQAEGRPGGLGLKLIRSFVKLNGGRLQIVSDRGYWCLEEGGEPFMWYLPAPFPGTVVNIEINTADQHSYRLREEVDPQKIF